MTSTVRVRRDTGKTMNDDTLRNETATTIIYGDPDGAKGKIRIAAASAGISEREPLGQSIAVQEMILSLPVAGEGSGDVRKDDFVDVIENPDDPALEGHTFRVRKFPSQTSATARRFIVEEVE